MRKPSQEGKLKDKFEADDKIKIETAVQDKSQLAEKDEFESRELEDIVNPIMMKVSR